MNNNPTKKELVEILDSSFFAVALADMKNCLNANPNLPVFILGVCFIDALSGFAFGKTKKHDNQDKGRFKNFVKRYLTGYNADDLWEVRSDLLHSYATHQYSFANKKSYLHNKTTVDGKKIINDEDFYSDIETAYRNFRNDILKDSKIFTNTKKRLLVFGVMKINETEIPDIPKK